MKDPEPAEKTWHHGDRPASFLQEVFHLFSSRIPRGRALDVACGKGRNALFLAEIGFEVDAVDISEAALQEAGEKAQRKGLVITFRSLDLEQSDLAESAYDLILDCNFLFRPLISKLKGAIKLGGYIVFDTFLVDQRVIGHPRHLSYLLGHNELLEMFHDFRVLYYREGRLDEGGRAAYRAGLFAQKVK